MSNKPAHRQSSEFDGNEELFSRLVAGDLTSEERQDLEARLNEDAAFRDTYLRWSAFDADMRQLMSQGELPVSLSERDSRPPSVARRHALRFAIVAASLGIAAALWWTVAHQPRAQGPLAGNNTSGPLSDHLTFQSAAEKSGLGQFVAVVVRAEGMAPRDTQAVPPGQRLGEGRLQIESGNLLLCFLGGASLYLEGPAELLLQSPSSATLMRGRAAIRDSENSRPFRLDVPNAAMVDLGTEFAVRTDDAGNSLVRVHEGAVSVSTLDEKGNSKVSDVLRADEVAALHPAHSRPIQPQTDDGDFSRVPGIPQLPLPISSDYVTAVLESRPSIYWRFEGLDTDGMIPDHGSLGCRGRVLNRGEPAALAIREGALQLSASTRPRRIESENPIPILSGGEYSIELWARTSRVEWQTIFGMLTGKPDVPPSALGQIEYADQTFLVHGPMAIRSLSRPEGGQGGGNNLFGEDLWVPGMWNHIVVVRASTAHRLYVDGQFIGSSELSPTTEETPCTLILGQLRDVELRQGGRRPRQFLGSIDEFAFYGHALSEAEIGRHWSTAIGSEAP